MNIDFSLNQLETNSTDNSGISSALLSSDNEDSNVDTTFTITLGCPASHSIGFSKGIIIMHVS